MAQTNWYTANTSGDQGLIVSEETGANIAVAYDKKDAPLLAAAPELLDACKVIERTPHIRAWLVWNDPKALEQLEQAVHKAEGKDR